MSHFRLKKSKDKCLPSSFYGKLDSLSRQRNYTILTLQVAINHQHLTLQELINHQQTCSPHCDIGTYYPT